MRRYLLKDRIHKALPPISVFAVICTLLLSGPDVAAQRTPDDFVLIPAGTFLMGSPEDEALSRVDETLHEVTLTRPYLLARTELTQALWTAVMDTNPGYFAGCDDCPIESVSWLDAVNFCNRFSRQQGLTAAYLVKGEQVELVPNADGFRLPTEAEWEYACRAGTRTVFSSGDCLSADEANYNGYAPQAGCPSGLYRGEPISVASFAPNAWGLHDMHGNLNEFCWDIYSEYPDGQAVDPRGAMSGSERVFRGGAFNNHARKCHSATRERMYVRHRFDMIGLRLARSVPVGRESQ